MADDSHLAALSAATNLLFQKSGDIFWSALPVCVLISFLSIYLGPGGVSGEKIEGLFRRILIAIAALVAFPEISQAIQGIEGYLVNAFGGETSLQQVFSQLSDRADQLKQSGTLNWFDAGQVGLNIIATLSFLILALVRHFLDMLHLMIWNLMHILGPIAFLGCLFPSFSQVSRGILIGMLELALWKPIWIILGRLLIAVGFGDIPNDVSEWFDTAVLNFAVAGLMASTPVIVHSLLSGSIGALGGSMVQTMVSGVGGALAAQPMRAVQNGVSWATSAATQGVRSTFGTMARQISADQTKFIKNPQGKRGK
jgi:hypothetical protein